MGLTGHGFDAPRTSFSTSPMRCRSRSTHVPIAQHNLAAAGLVAQYRRLLQNNAVFSIIRFGMKPAALLQY
jgi:hypothetical protein